MSRSSSRSSSRVRPSVEKASEEETADDAEKTMEIHREIGDYIVVVYEADKKARVLYFARGVKKTNWNTIRLDTDFKYSEQGLRVGSNVVVYFAATPLSRAGWYKTAVHGTYGQEKQAKEHVKNVQKGHRCGKPKVSDVLQSRNNAMHGVLMAVTANVNLPDAGDAIVGGTGTFLQDPVLSDEPSDLARNIRAINLNGPATNTTDTEVTSDTVDASLLLFGENNPETDEIDMELSPLEAGTGAPQLAVSQIKRGAQRKAASMFPQLRYIIAEFYWKKDIGGCVNIRPGYNIYVKRPIMKDLVENFGSDSFCRGGWMTYAWKLVLHLMGGTDNAVAMKRMQKGVGVDMILKEETLAAVLSHTKDLHNIETPYQLTWFKQRMNGNLSSLCDRAREKLSP